MIDWLLDWIPLWVWIIAGVIGLIAAQRMLGWKGMFAVLAAMVTLGAYRAGRKTGGADAVAKQEKVNKQAVQEHERIEAETDGMSDAELDDANAPWVRKRR